jgi:hypothetical protein
MQINLGNIHKIKTKIQKTKKLFLKIEANQDKRKKN